MGQVEGPRSTSMHPTLLTQLLGKVGEAWLTHAKASNLPKLVGASCAELVFCWWPAFGERGKQHIVILGMNFNPSQSQQLVFCLPACAELACVQKGVETASLRETAL